MVRQILDRGTTGNDGTGDDLFTGNTINLPDSSGTIALTKNIDSAVNNTINTIDSDYVQERTREANIDFIQLRNYTVATAPDSSEVSHGTLIFVKDGNTGLPCLGVFDSDLGNFRRIELGSYINT